MKRTFTIPMMASTRATTLLRGRVGKARYGAEYVVAYDKRKSEVSKIELPDSVMKATGSAEQAEAEAKNGYSVFLGFVPGEAVGNGTSWKEVKLTVESPGLFFRSNASEAINVTKAEWSRSLVDTKSSDSSLQIGKVTLSKETSE